MSTAIPTIKTERLIIRPFVLEDLLEAHRILSDAWDVPRGEQAGHLLERERWLRWTITNYEELAKLRQPAYGDRAIVLKADGKLIGSVGLVPALGPFGQLPNFPAHHGSQRWYPEFGLFWAVDPVQQKQGFATEAARGLIDRAFEQFNLGRVIAMTEFGNQRSISVMRKLGMEILRNPLPEPAWFQIVGLLNREM